MKVFKSLDEVTPGMVTVKPVKDQNGRLLMPEGSELTQDWINRFQQWGVKGVYIDDPDAQGDENVLDEATVIKDQEKKFALVKANPNMTLLMEASIKHLLSRQEE